MTTAIVACLVAMTNGASVFEAYMTGDLVQDKGGAVIMVDLSNAGDGLPENLRAELRSLVIKRDKCVVKTHSRGEK